jgi:hypothetical protein
VYRIPSFDDLAEPDEELKGFAFGQTAVEHYPIRREPASHSHRIASQC